MIAKESQQRAKDGYLNVFNRLIPEILYEVGIDEVQLCPEPPRGLEGVLFQAGALNTSLHSTLDKWVVKARFEKSCVIGSRNETTDRFAVMEQGGFVLLVQSNFSAPDPEDWWTAIYLTERQPGLYESLVPKVFGVAYGPTLDALRQMYNDDFSRADALVAEIARAVKSCSEPTLASGVSP